MYERTLDKIRIKVRRYVARLSPERLEDTQLDEFIFEAMRYDLAEDLRFNKLKTTFDLITTPNVGVYNLAKMAIPDPDGRDFVRMINLYEDFFPPASIENTCLKWVTKASDFCLSNQITVEKHKLKGKNLLGPYTFTLKAPILQKNVYLYISSPYDEPIVYRDVPESRSLGFLKNIKDFDETIDSYINYIQGCIEVTFSDSVSSDQEIIIQYKTYISGKPNSIYFNGYAFHLSPIPDDSYVITMGAYKNPERLLLDNDSPEIDKWSDYIAFAAARRIFRESDNFEALARFEREKWLEEDKNIYRKSVQLRAKTPNSNRVYSNSSYDCCCCYDLCGLPKNPFNLR